MPINLLPWRKQYYQQQRSNFYKKLRRYAVFFIAFWCVVQIENLYRLTVISEKIKAVQQSLLHIDLEFSKAEKVVNQQHMQLVIQQQINKMQHQNLAMFRFLLLLSAKMPENLYLTAVEKKENSAFFVGKSTSHMELARLLSELNHEDRDQKFLLKVADHSNNADNMVDFDFVYDLSGF